MYKIQSIEELSLIDNILSKDVALCPFCGIAALTRLEEPGEYQCASCGETADSGLLSNLYAYMIMVYSSDNPDSLSDISEHIQPGLLLSFVDMLITEASGLAAMANEYMLCMELISVLNSLLDA